MKLLLQPVTELKGVGAKTSERLKKLEILTFRDLLFHMPARYLDKTRVSSLSEVEDGQMAVIEGTIARTAKYGKQGKGLSVTLIDSEIEIALLFFHIFPNQTQQFQVGKKVRCFGKCEDRYGNLQMVHPEYELLSSHKVLPLDTHLLPVYPTTEGVSQRLLRDLVTQALTLLQPLASVLNWLPEPLQTNWEYPDWLAMLKQVHFPLPGNSAEGEAINTLEENIYFKQLAFEELLAHHVYLKFYKNKQEQYQRYQVITKQPVMEKFLQLLPFSLTAAQQQVISEIEQDFLGNNPMLRLIQGDVGSGKTVVALYAALLVLGGGKQVAMMAPTTVLAEQHYQTAKKYLRDLGIEVAYLSSEITLKGKKCILNDLQQGKINFIIGTQALFQKEVQFKNLALTIIDEQQRFGVEQRVAFYDKGKNNDYVPHQLILTATPIPRTLAMSYYADLDVSTIKALPKARKPITTAVVHQSKKSALLKKLYQQCQNGQQIYWVCPLIEQVTETVELLQKQLPGTKVTWVHGKLASSEKELRLQQFKQGQADILVATTVIEVGIDVPQANYMVIEYPEQFGLSQLHQLRGRVGRGSQESFCVLLYGETLTDIAKQRLAIIKSCSDGFEIAEKDLELRGAGDLLGTEQSGDMPFQVAQLSGNNAFLKTIAQRAQDLLQNAPEAGKKLVGRWIAIETITLDI